MSTSTARLKAPFAYRNFRILFGAELMQRSGSYVSFTAISLTLGASQESTSLLLGLLGLFITGPSLVLAPLAGSLIKRKHRAIVLRSAQLWFALANSLCAILYSGPHTSQPVLLFGALLFGIGLAVTAPTLSAFIRDIIHDEKDLASANSVSWATLNLVVLIGGLVGGVVYANFGATACFSCAAITNIAAFAGLTRLGENTPSQTIQDFSSPSRFSWFYSAVGLVILFELLTSFAANPYLFQLPLVNQHLTGGAPLAYSFLLAAGACGGIMGGLALIIYKPPSLVGFMTLCLFSIGTCLTALALARGIFIAALAIFFLNVAIAALMVSETTFIQTHTREAERGQVMGFFMMAHIGVLPFGSFFLYGLVGEIVGTLNVFAIAGSLFLGTFVLTRLMLKQKLVSHENPSL